MQRIFRRLPMAESTASLSDPSQTAISRASRALARALTRSGRGLKPGTPANDPNPTKDVADAARRAFGDDYATNPHAIADYRHCQSLARLSPADLARMNAAARTLVAHGYTYHGGIQWRPPQNGALFARPPYGSPAIEAALARNRDAQAAKALRNAIAFALDPHTPDGLEWLRDWSHGEPDALKEAEAWAARRETE